MAEVASGSRPTVSVAILSYNQRDYLRECIDSILAQDYPDIEIVVADDGSTDGTAAMVEDLAARHPGRFVLELSPVQRGITANANAAHFACTGDYIAWMGGDDLMLPGKIRRQVEVMESNPDCALCYHDLDTFLSGTGERLYLFSERNKPRQGGVRAAIRYGTFNGGCATMVRRSATPERGHDSRIERASDWLYWVETVAPDGRIIYIDEILGRYRRHARNITDSPEFARSLIEDHILSAIIILKAMPQFAPEAFHSLARNLVSLGRRTRGPGHWPILVLAAMVFAACLLTTPFSAAGRFFSISRATPRDRGNPS